ncbi:O-antigen ligase family protein [Halalkalicoccus tibetensis]|uniref:O-antigen ligase family protein n=1 Tax=Halalkalicoccus tibetensis TaxID=175632 RepID=A0ABD5V2E1_9EURY
MDRSIGGLFVVFLLVVVLREVGVGVDSGLLVALHLVSFGLLIAVVASITNGVRADDRRAVAVAGLQIALAVLAGAAVVWHARVEGLGFEGLAVVYLAMIGLALAHAGERGALRSIVPYLLGYVLLAGVFLQHVLDVAPTSGLALFPVFAAVTLGLCLFVIPRYAAEPVFHRSLVAIATVFAVVGLSAAFLGEYTVGGFEVALWGERSLPFVDREVPIIQSVFGNPNTLGLAVFPGLVAAVVEFHRVAVERRSDWGVVFVPLVVLLGVALYLTNSRGSMLAAATGIAIYGVYALAGRRAVPAGVALGYGGALAALTAVFVLLPGTDGQRGALWSAGLEAYLASPTALGEGLVGTGDLIAPYLENPGSTVHNSYLSVLLRTGLVGIVGYLLVVVAPTIHGAIRRRTVSPGALALAGAFVIHQFFEGYTIYQYDFGAVLGALAAGYLIVSLGRDTGNTDPDRAGSTTSDAR